MLRRSTFAWLLILIAGCSESPQERLDAALESLASWASTASLVARQWSAGELPDAYVKKTASIAADEIKKQRQQLAGAPSNELARDAASQVERAWQQLGTAVESSDRGVAADLVGPMRDLAEKLDRAREEAGG